MGLFGKDKNSKERLANFNEMATSIRQAIGQDKLGYYLFIKAGVLKVNNPDYDKWGELKNIGSDDLNLSFVNKEGNEIIVKLKPGMVHSKIQMIENGCVKIIDKDTGKEKAVKVDEKNIYYKEIEEAFNHTADHGVDYDIRKFNDALNAASKGKPFEYNLSDIYGTYMCSGFSKFVDSVNKAEPMIKPTDLDLADLTTVDVHFDKDNVPANLNTLEQLSFLDETGKLKEENKDAAGGSSFGNLDF